MTTEREPPIIQPYGAAAGTTLKLDPPSAPTPSFSTLCDMEDPPLLAEFPPPLILPPPQAAATTLAADGPIPTAFLAVSFLYDVPLHTAQRNYMYHARIRLYTHKGSYRPGNTRLEETLCPRQSTDCQRAVSCWLGIVAQQLSIDCVWSSDCPST